MPDFYEFFCGGGMARAGLGANWRCLFANDIDVKKSRTYEKNWGSGVLQTADVATLATSDLPGKADLAWASFPCQDLSLAGNGVGLRGHRSGTFWPFWNLMKKIKAEGRAPQIIVLENVCGTLTSHEGKDFAAICSELEQENYQYGAVVIDAALFVPQSRPRLFIIGVQEDVEIPASLSGDPMDIWHTRAVRKAYDRLPVELTRKWIWWRFPEPEPRAIGLSDIIEEEPLSVKWHSDEETHRLLSMMSPVHLAKVEEAKHAGRRMIGTIYKRTRRDEHGSKVQRAEVRFDDVAGCLRTPTGGSSRQLIIVVDGDLVRSRLISSRETARLMGLPDHYQLPDHYNEAYHLTGDGVVVPVVRHLAIHAFEPILTKQKKTGWDAA